MQLFWQPYPSLPAGNVGFTGQIYTILPATLVPGGTTQEIDWNQGNARVIDLENATGDVTLTFTNPHAGATYIIQTIQGSTERALTWPAEVLWPDGITGSLSSANDAIDIISLFYNGTNYLATLANAFA